MRADYKKKGERNVCVGAPTFYRHGYFLPPLLLLLLTTFIFLLCFQNVKLVQFENGGRDGRAWVVHWRPWYDFYAFLIKPGLDVNGGDCGSWALLLSNFPFFFIIIIISLCLFFFLPRIFLYVCIHWMHLFYFLFLFLGPFVCYRGSDPVRIK